METTAIVWFVLIAVLWIGFIVLEGFDLGVGMRMLFATRDERERRVMLNTIGPVWDGNAGVAITAGAALRRLPGMVRRRPVLGARRTAHCGSGRAHPACSLDRVARQGAHCPLAFDVDVRHRHGLAHRRLLHRCDARADVAGSADRRQRRPRGRSVRVAGR